MPRQCEICGGESHPHYEPRVRWRDKAARLLYALLRLIARKQPVVLDVSALPTEMLRVVYSHYSFYTHPNRQIFKYGSRWHNNPEGVQCMVEESNWILSQVKPELFRRLEALK